MNEQFINRNIKLAPRGTQALTEGKERRRTMMSRREYEEKGWNEVKKGITDTIQHLAVLRREAILLGIDKEDVDEMIYTESKGQFDKFEDMSEGRLMVFMLGEILTNAPKDMIKDMFDDLGGELNG